MPSTESCTTRLSRSWSVARASGVDRCGARSCAGSSRRPQATRALPVHRALLNLARRRTRPGSETGYRLVTTNFDDRFEQAGLPRVWIEQGPRLSRPRPESLRKVVYLHGRIELELPEEFTPTSRSCADERGLRQRLPAGGLGRESVIELFREFTILFVGYGLNDPVMRYLMDALATESHPGGQLSGHSQLRHTRAGRITLVPDRKRSGAPRTSPRSCTLRITPTKNHLRCWPRRWPRGPKHVSGLSGQLATALGLARRPYVPGAGDAAGLGEVAAVAWALSEPSGDVARRFAEAEPAPDISWLAPVTAYEVRDARKPTQTCRLLELESVRPALATWVCLHWRTKRQRSGCWGGRVIYSGACRPSWLGTAAEGRVDHAVLPFRRFWLATLVASQQRAASYHWHGLGGLEIEGERLTDSSRASLLAALKPRLVGPQRPYRLSVARTAPPRSLDELARFEVETIEEHAESLRSDDLSRLRGCIGDGRFGSCLRALWTT